MHIIWLSSFHFVFIILPIHNFFILDEEQALGEANCGIEGESTSSTPENRPGEVALKILSRGAYFGEAALVRRSSNFFFQLRSFSMVVGFLLTARKKDGSWVLCNFCENFKKNKVTK